VLFASGLNVTPTCGPAPHHALPHLAAYAIAAVADCCCCPHCLLLLLLLLLLLQEQD
jgi:hypothetical protein